MCKIWDRSVQPFYRDDETYIHTEITTLYMHIDNLFVIFKYEKLLFYLRPNAVGFKKYFNPNMSHIKKIQ